MRQPKPCTNVQEATYVLKSSNALGDAPSWRVQLLVEPSAALWSTGAGWLRLWLQLRFSCTAIASLRAVYQKTLPLSAEGLEVRCARSFCLLPSAHQSILVNNNYED